MHRYECRLARNGNSTQVTLPRNLLGYLGWLAGEYVVVELTGKNTIEIYPTRELQRVNPGPARSAGDTIGTVEP